MPKYYLFSKHSPNFCMYMAGNAFVHNFGCV